MSDAPQHWRKAQMGGAACLLPADDRSEAWLARRAAGSTVAMRPEQVRNAERSALYWVLCSLVADNHADLETREQVSDTIKLLTGHVDTWALSLPDGEKYFAQRPRSISFASMSEADFETYLDAACDVIATHILPGIDIEDLRREAYLGAGVSRPTPAR